MPLFAAILATALTAAAPAARLGLAEGLEGKLRVEDQKGAVVLELDKRPGAAVEVSLPPGAYTIHRSGPDCGQAVASVALENGARREVAAGDFVAPPGGGASALGVFARTGPLRGVALGALSTEVEGDARWLQASLGYNAAAGAMTGVQFAPGLNLAEGPVTGAQIAVGINRAGGSLRGFQFGGVFNSAQEASIGVQASGGLNAAPAGFIGLQVGGAANWAGDLLGGQMALVNLAGDSAGVQLGGIVNRVDGLRGGQLAPVNLGGDVTGAQLGVVNVARRITGFQLGLVNVADEARGVPFGLVNAIRDGQMHFEVFGSDLQPVNFALKSGSRHFFTTLMVGGGRTNHFLGGLGAGLHVGGDVLWLDTDLVGTTTLEAQRGLELSNVGGHLRALGGLQLGPIGVFAGPTLNALVSFRTDRIASGSYLAPLVQFGRVQLWPGAEVGLRL